MLRILVTGGAGFIGSHLCEALLAQGHAVTCLDNFVTGSLNNIRHLPALKVIEGDINQLSTFERLKGEFFDTVFHYAATVGVQRTEEHPGLVLEDIHGIRHIAELAKQGRVGKIIFASSSEVYGEPRHLPEQEEHGIMGWSPYATVKLYGEYLFSSLWQEHNIPTVSLRFFNVYGPRQRGSAYGFVTARFIEQVMAGTAPTVFGDGTQTRDLVYVEDNIQAALAAMERVEAHGQVINVGSGFETPIIDLAHTIIRSAGQEEALQPLFLPGRKVEISRRCASVEKMKLTLGMSCTVSLSVGIKETLRHDQKIVEYVRSPAQVAQGA